MTNNIFKIMWLIVFLFFCAINNTQAKETMYKLPTWWDINTANQDWTITSDTWYLYANNTTANQFCVEVGGIYVDYNSARLSNDTDLVKYKTNWVTWTKRNDNDIINDIICDVPVDTASGSTIINIDNGFNSPIFTEQDIKDIYLVEFVILLLILIVKFFENLVWRKFDIKIF